MCSRVAPWFMLLLRGNAGGSEGAGDTPYMDDDRGGAEGAEAYAEEVSGRAYGELAAGACGYGED